MVQHLKYTDEMLRAAVDGSDSIAEVLRKLGLRPAGGNHVHISHRLARAGIDVSHFNGKTANRGARHVGGLAKLQATDILVLRSPETAPIKAYMLRRALIESGVPEVCSVCGSPPIWHGQPLRLQIDHINGRRWDNRPHNVRFICPNCHNQTDNFGSKNKALLRLEADSSGHGAAW